MRIQFSKTADNSSYTKEEEEEEEVYSMILELCRDASRELGLRAPLCDGGRNTRRVTITNGPGAPSCVTALAQVPAVAKITNVTFNRDNEVQKKKKKKRRRRRRAAVAYSTTTL